MLIIHYWLLTENYNILMITIKLHYHNFRMFNLYWIIHLFRAVLSIAIWECCLTLLCLCTWCLQLKLSEPASVVCLSSGNNYMMWFVFFQLIHYQKSCNLYKFDDDIFRETTLNLPCTEFADLAILYQQNKKDTYLLPHSSSW